ncbi:hypothetical protein MPER_08548, partial [Moniliophthora perniciosa FA553]
AYEGDFSMLISLGGDWSLAPDISRAIIRATLLEGEVYVVKNDSDEIVSFGLWFRPGTEVFSTPEQRALGFDDFFKKLKTEMQAWYQNTYPEYSKKYLDGAFRKEVDDSSQFITSQRLIGTIGNVEALVVFQPRY